MILFKFQKEKQIRMNVYRTNFIFEKQLQSTCNLYMKSFIPEKWNYEFEYLFFFVNQDDILNSPIRYPKSYLEYLKKTLI